jgi:heme-degrading monooxygenase HmoA
LLRRQPGFRDEIAFVTPGGTEAFAISLWDTKESADAYSRDTYPEVLRVLADVVEGTPRVETYEVVNSTSHHLAVPS